MKTCKNDLTKVKARISSGRIEAKDIKYEDRLTSEQISEIPARLVYAWVQNRQWTNKDFNKWLDSFSYEN